MWLSRREAWRREARGWRGGVRREAGVAERTLSDRLHDHGRRRDVLVRRQRLCLLVQVSVERRVREVGAVDVVVARRDDGCDQTYVARRVRQGARRGLSWSGRAAACTKAAAVLAQAARAAAESVWSRSKQNKPRRGACCTCAGEQQRHEEEVPESSHGEAASAQLDQTLPPGSPGMTLYTSCGT